MIYFHTVIIFSMFCTPEGTTSDFMKKSVPASCSFL